VAIKFQGTSGARKGESTDQFLRDGDVKRELRRSQKENYASPTEDSSELSGNLFVHSHKQGCEIRTKDKCGHVPREEGREDLGGGGT